MKIQIYFLIVLIAFAFNQATAYSKESAASAETSSLNGYVTDAKTDETLIGASVSIQQIKMGTYTNKLGYFSITNIPEGEYIVDVSYLGYNKLKKKIKFKKGIAIRETFKMVSAGVETDEVEVEANREVEKREISISKINIPIQQIKKIRVGGESDVFRSLQFLPGILTSSQLSSGLYVRGGSPDQNLVLLDGSIVYNPSHLFGFISTFNSDAIKDVELIKGGYPAEYGGRLSAVLNITQKDGNKQNVEGQGSIGVISSKLSLQGPLPFIDGSWFIGGRRTYFELIKMLIPSDPLSPLPDFNFYDLNMKVNINIGDNDKLAISSFLSSDYLKLGTFGVSLGMDIANQTASARWTHIFSDHVFSVFNLSTSYYKNNFAGDQSNLSFLINNSINDITGKYTLEWFLNKELTMKFGVESNRYLFKYYQNFTGLSDTSSKENVSSFGYTKIDTVDWNHSIFAQFNYNFSDFVSFQGGLRTNYWQISNHLLFDPRFALRYRFQENMAIKAAWGIYSQNLRLAAQPDFSFFDTWLPTDKTLPAARSEHYILSLETQPAEGYDLNFDVYYKKMHNVSELNTNMLDPKQESSVFLIGNAEAWGFEVFVQKKFGSFAGWVGYALGFIEAKYDSINGGDPFRPKYDRRHDFKTVLQYQISDKWEVSATFTLQSGQSYTGATSRFLIRLPGDSTGKGKIVPSQRYGLRLPISHQLNLSTSYSFKMFNLDSKIILDIFNVYSHRDIWFRYYDLSKPEASVLDVYLLPIIPTLSFEVKF